MKIMKISSIFGGLALAICMVTGASAIEVMNKVEVKTTPDKAWAAIGAFCDVKNWHPALASCEISKKGDATFRMLTTKDGAKIFEQELSRDDKAHSYSYAIIESPLPVTNYKATIKVDPGTGGNVAIVWVASFDPKGPEADAKKVIGGIFAAGLDSLKAQLDGK